MPLLALLIFSAIASPIAITSAVFAAPGEAVADCTTSPLAVNATVDIRPAANVEWIIHNLKFQLNVELQTVFGATAIAWRQYVGPAIASFIPATHLTNGNYLRVKNIDAAVTQYICWDGVVTK